MRTSACGPDTAMSGSGKPLSRQGMCVEYTDRADWCQWKNAKRGATEFSGKIAPVMQAAYIQL
ncbi:MAG: hypothetical protein GY903_12950 [Fuerstiella sp.]|nr:hypothetical protein [Fuerstiella sp.]MCP4855393.1 hypothetical protein [Fuerstiella sp.]